MTAKFDYQGARSAGYSDEDIETYLQESVPDFDIKGARGSGYSLQEISDFISKGSPRKQEEESIVETINQSVNKAGRLATQGAIGGLQRVAIPYDLLATGATQIARKPVIKVAEEIEEQKPELAEKIKEKQTPLARQLESKFRGALESQEEMAKGKEIFPKEFKENNFDLGSLIEAGAGKFGVDLSPQGAGEMALRFIGIMNKPKEAVELFKSGLNPAKVKDFLKSALPTQKEAISGSGAAVGLQIAAENEFGPMGTLFSVIAGDALPALLAKGAKPVGAFIKAPGKTSKELLAKGTKKLSEFKKTQQQKQLQKEIIKSFREAGIQADLGTITDNNLVKSFQTAIDQSSLTGNALDKFKKDLLQNITNQYAEIADSIGESKFQNVSQLAHDLGKVARVEDTYLGAYKPHKGYRGRSLVGRVATEEAPQLANSEQQFLHEISPRPFVNDKAAGEELRGVAESIERPIKERFKREYTQLNDAIGTINVAPQAELATELSEITRELGGSLVEGASPAEAKFLRETRRLLKKLTIDGDTNQLIGTNIEELIKTRRTLGDIPNWEIRGSRYNQQFKHVYGLVNQAIEKALGKSNPALLRRYKELNQRYSEYKDVFENKSVAPLFQQRNVKNRALFRQSLDPDKIEAYEQILNQTEGGRRVLNRLKRDYVQSKFSGRQLDTREIENLRSVLGEEHEGALNQLSSRQQREGEAYGGLPRAARPQTTKTIPSPFKAWIPGKDLQGRVTVSSVQKAQKFFQSIKNKSPEQIGAMINSASSMREIREILSKTSEGRDLYNSIARFKLDEIFGSNLKEGVRNQLKLGTFSKVLSNRKNRDLVREIVGPEAFRRLERLEGRTAQLSETAQKFFNSSKSGTRAADYVAAATLVGQAFKGIASFLIGNPWPLALVTGEVLGGRYLTNLLGDAEFLRLVEEAILVPTKDISRMEAIALNLGKKIEKAKELAQATAQVTASKRKKEKSNSPSAP